MDILLQQAINSLSIGAIYALIAVGLTLTFGVLNILNFAHGEFFMLGAFGLFFALEQIGLGYVPAVFVSIGILAAVGWSTGKILNLQADRSFETMILITLGISLILQNGALAIWGVNLRTVRTALSGSGREFFGAVISDQRLLVLIVTVFVFIILDQIIRKTRIGKAMRAVAQNSEAAAVVGIDTAKISLFTLLLGSALAGLSGALVAPIISVTPLMGLAYLMRCFAIIAMAGRGNVKGAIVASFALALIEGLGVQLFSLAFKDAFAFLALIVVLLVKPEGLFGRKAGLV